MAVSVLGTLLIVAGGVMLVTPGPGLLAIIAGLAVWSREFRWARRMLDGAKRRVAARMGRRQPDTIVIPDATTSRDTPEDDVPVTRRVA